MKAILGIDTSNYKTSLALVDRNGNILADERRLLTVKEGQRGLRQQEALFQHTVNLPELVEKILADQEDLEICAVAVSTRPRPVEGSYMPCFRAGEGLGRSIASVLGVPCYCFSHQEGHIEAARTSTGLAYDKGFLAVHNSGGTCELLKVDGSAIEIIGGSKDISFGQLLDRAGVAMGLAFPAGESMDRLALEAGEGSYSELNGLKRPAGVHIENLTFNLSGPETHYTRLAHEVYISAESRILPENKGAFENCSCSYDSDYMNSSADTGDCKHTADADYNKKHQYNPMEKQMCILSKEILDYIGSTLMKLIRQARKETGIQDVLLVGGVSSSTYLIKYYDSRIHTGNRALSSDNAVGIALLGRSRLWG